VPQRDKAISLKDVKMEVEIGFDPATGYKEAERIPAEIRTAMEPINGNLFVKMGTAWWLLSR